MAYKIDQAVGYNLKIQRLKRGLTQEALGNLAGMSKQGISNIESGKGAASKTITTIADCLDISPFDLYKEIEQDANINFQRIISPNRIYLNRPSYKEKISEVIDNVISDTKDKIYYEAVTPTVKESFKLNKDILLQRLEAKRSVVNHNILEVFSEELLSNIRKSIYNEYDGKNDSIEDDEVEELLEDDEIEELVEDDTQNNQAENKPVTENKRPYDTTGLRRDQIEWLDELYGYKPNSNKDQ